MEKKRFITIKKSVDVLGSFQEIQMSEDQDVVLYKVQSADGRLIFEKTVPNDIFGMEKLDKLYNAFFNGVY